jgi:hypothetical protein
MLQGRIALALGLQKLLNMAKTMKVLGEEIAFKDNLWFSLKRYPAWWLILLVTIIFDFFSTIFFVDQSGVSAEANLVVGWLMTNLGVYTGLVIGKLLQLISVVVFVCLNRRLGNLFLLVVILLNSWAVVINVK